MRNREGWRPSKYVRRNGRLVASRDPREVAVGTRLVADLVAAAYDAALPRHARGRLLDLGCGKAPLFETYRDRVTDVTCADWGKSLHGGAYLDVECDLTEPLPFREKEFDTILLSDVLEHIPEPLRLWAEMARVLAPGGRILLNVPFLYWLHEQPHDYYRFTEFALRRFAEGAGLAVLELGPVGGWPQVMADLFAKGVAGVPLVGRPLASLAQWLARKGGGKPTAFPLGYFLVAGKPA